MRRVEDLRGVRLLCGSDSRLLVLESYGVCGGLGEELRIREVDAGPEARFLNDVE